MPTTRADQLATVKDLHQPPDLSALHNAILILQNTEQAPSSQVSILNSSVGENEPKDNDTSGTRLPDSGYGTQPSTPETYILPSGGRKKLKSFNKPIPQKAELCFYDWKVLFWSQLRDIFIQSNASRADMLMRLRYLGISEADSKLYLVFQCHPGLTTSMKKFLDQKHVRGQCQSQFECIIIPRQPERLNSNGRQLVYRAKNPLQPTALTPSTLCGTQIMIQNRTSPPILATIGGVILIETASWTFLCCMIAGHVISGLDLSNLDKDIPDVAEDDNVTVAIDEIYETCQGRPGVQRVIDEEVGSIGFIWEPSTSTSVHVRAGLQNEPKHPSKFDWALVVLHPNPQYLTNTLLRPTRSISLSHPPHTPSRGSEVDVDIVTGQSGILKGRIRFYDSDMLFDGCEDFTSLHHITFQQREPGEASSGSPKPASVLTPMHLLRPGDSGSWVVDSLHGWVYGHVIEVDIFGDGYVVPIEECLEDIKERAGARRVAIPSEEEIIALGRKSRYVGYSGDSGYASVDSSPTPYANRM